MQVDYLIVGAGFAGCVLAERIANLLDKKVLIVEKRPHIGGNCYDFLNELGIVVHKYGPHAFHTNSKKCWEYLSNFTDWHFYEHKVLCYIDGKKVPIPFNLNSIEQIFSPPQAKRYVDKLISNYGFNKKIPILKLSETNDKDLKELAEFIYNKVFLGYNLKQWAKKPEELSSFVSARVPVYISRDNRYFQDTYQAIPKMGYTALFNKMLSNSKIETLLNCDYRDIINDVKFDKMIYTGAIDEFFDFLYGELPYRSLEFRFENIEKEYFQEVAQVNYPNDYDFTRITEFKHFLDAKTEKTTIAYEYSKSHILNKTERYYPVPCDENEELYLKYKAETEKLKSVIFIGRLAEYKYYNMDEIIVSALRKFEYEIAK